MQLHELKSQKYKIHRISFSVDESGDRAAKEKWIKKSSKFVAYKFDQAND